MTGLRSRTAPRRAQSPCLVAGLISGATTRVGSGAVPFLRLPVCTLHAWSSTVSSRRGGHASMCRARSRLAALPCCQTWQLSSCKNQHRMQDLLLAIFAGPCGDGHQGSSFPSREEQDPMILEAVCAPVSRSDARPLPALLRDACCGLPAICACFK
jgi:hypothetical protein